MKNPLETMAENARELGLDYEPAKDNSNYRFDPPGLDPSHQKPVACQYAKDVAMPEYRCVGRCQYDTSPPAQRTWVNATTWRGLTDEEVIAMSRYDLEYAALIGEVQRRLKEKNT